MTSNEDPATSDAAKPERERECITCGVACPDCHEDDEDDAAPTVASEGPVLYGPDHAVSKQGVQPVEFPDPTPQPVPAEAWDDDDLCAIRSCVGDVDTDAAGLAVSPFCATHDKAVRELVAQTPPRTGC